MRYTFDGPVWRGTSTDTWYFVTLPIEAAQGLRALHGKASGFGSIRVRAEIGPVAWKTSVFPDRRTGSFLLPIKADVRRRTNLTAGDVASVAVEMET